jgi:hypothetical protein
MSAALRWLLVCCALVSACKDPGVIGRTSPCTKPCSGDQLCHPTLAICVSCVQDRDCASRGNGDKVRCDLHDFSCVECKTATDCGLDKPYCVKGKCEDMPSDDESTGSSDDHSDHSAAGGGGGGGGDNHGAAGD